MRACCPPRCPVTQILTPCFNQAIISPKVVTLTTASFLSLPCLSVVFCHHHHCHHHFYHCTVTTITYVTKITYVTVITIRSTVVPCTKPNPSSRGGSSRPTAGSICTTMRCRTCGDARGSSTKPRTTATTATTTTQPINNNNNNNNNSWIHLYDYALPNLWGCTGVFD